jgi:hypothetical protein
MTWNRWTTVSEGRAGPGTSVTAVPIEDEDSDRFALFLADPGGGVFTASQNAQLRWSIWSPVPGRRAGPGASVTVVPFHRNRFALFLVDPGGRIFTASGNAKVGWTQWSSVAGRRAGLGTSIAAARIGGDRFALFLTDPGGEVFTTSGSARRGWAPWTTVSEGRAGPGTSVTAVPIEDEDSDRFALFLADPGGGVFTASGNSTIPVRKRQPAAAKR